MKRLNVPVDDLLYVRAKRVGIILNQFFQDCLVEAVTSMEAKQAEQELYESIYPQADISPSTTQDALFSAMVRAHDQHVEKSSQDPSGTLADRIKEAAERAGH